MASNKDLRTEITALCVERGAALPENLDDLKNDKLVEILDGLRKPAHPVIDTPLRPLVAPSPPEGASGSEVVPPPVVTAPVVTTPRDSAAPALDVPPTPKRQEATGAAGYFVAQGKVVHPTRREPQGAFEQVYPADFANGAAELDRLVSAGYVFRRG